MQNFISDSFIENVKTLNHLVSPKRNDLDKSTADLRLIIFNLLETEKGVIKNFNSELNLTGIDSFHLWISCKKRLKYFLNQVMNDEMINFASYTCDKRNPTDLIKVQYIKDLECIAKTLNLLFKEEVFINDVISQFNTAILSLEEKYALLFN